MKKAILIAMFGILTIPAVASANARPGNDNDATSRNESAMVSTQTDMQAQNQLASTDSDAKTAQDNAQHRVVAAKTHPFFKFLFGK